MQKAISNKIQLGQTLNPADNYGGVPSINDEGTLENLISKVDKIGKFIGTGKADKDLSRYYPNILPITRQAQIAGELPRKSYASLTYSDKKQLEFVLDLTAGTYTNYSTMEISYLGNLLKKQAKLSKWTTMGGLGFFWALVYRYGYKVFPDNTMILPTNNSVSIANYSNEQMKHLPAKSVTKLLKLL